MAVRVSMLAAKTDNMSSVLGINVVEGERQHGYVVL